MPKIVPSLVFAVVVGLSVSLASSAGAAESPLLEDAKENADLPTTVDLETALPPVSAELMSWASETQDRLNEIDQFATVGISDDRQSAQIYWFGPETQDLRRALDEAPAAYDVDVVPTEFNPGALRAAAVTLLETGSLAGADVTAAWAKHDGSGLGASTEPQGARREA